MGFPRALVGYGFAQPLEDLISRDKYDLTKFNEKQMDAFARFQGKTYKLLVGMGGNAMGLVYNRRLFQEAGLAEPPDTYEKPWIWSDWADNLAKLTKKSPDGKITQFGLGDYGFDMNYPGAYGGKWLTDDEKTITCDSDECVKAYTDFADLSLKSHVTPLPDEGTKLFGEGSLFFKQKVAIQRMGGWEGRAFAGKDAAGIDWAFMPFPKAKFATPDMVVLGNFLVKGSKNPEAGWQFMKWFLGK